MPTPDILHFLHVTEFMRAWVATHAEMSETRLLRWMGEQVGLSREQMRNLIYEPGHVVQPKTMPAFARLFGLDDHRREYLRCLIRLQGADPEHEAEARLAVWEMHAAATGVPADAVAAILEHETDERASEAIVAASLPLLRAEAEAERQRPAHLAEMLLGGPDPATVSRAMEAVEAGLTLGAPRPRAVELPAPGGPDDWETLCWHGALGLARQALLRPAQGDRHVNVIIGSADARAARAIGRAKDRLRTSLRKICDESAERPVTHLKAVLVEQVVIATPSARIYRTRHPGRRADSAPLPRAESTIKVGKAEPSSKPTPPGRPCIYHHLRFGLFVREMVTWRKAHRKRASAVWFARELGVSRTYANSLTNGTARLPPERAQRMAAVLNLSSDEAAYLDGLARYEEATDPEERARQRLALIQFAAQRGVRTLEGESFRITAHWAAHAILALADLRDFSTNPGWITRALQGRIPWQDARDLVAALLTAGLLMPRASGPPKPTSNERWYVDVERDLSAFACQDSTLRLLHAELRVPMPGEHFQGTLLALPEEALPRVHRVFADYLGAVRQVLRDADARAAAGQSELDRVILCSAQVFPLSPDLRTLKLRR